MNEIPAQSRPADGFPLRFAVSHEGRRRDWIGPLLGLLAIGWLAAGRVEGILRDLGVDPATLAVAWKVVAVVLVAGVVAVPPMTRETYRYDDEGNRFEAEWRCLWMKTETEVAPMSDLTGYGLAVEQPSGPEPSSLARLRLWFRLRGREDPLVLFVTTRQSVDGVRGDLESLAAAFALPRDERPAPERAPWDAFVLALHAAGARTLFLLILGILAAVAAVIVQTLARG